MARWEREKSPRLAGFRAAAAVPPEDNPRPLERGVLLDPWETSIWEWASRSPTTGARGDPALPRRLFGDGDTVPYGGTHFASKLGQLAGNHFLTVTGTENQLRPLGR